MTSTERSPPQKPQPHLHPTEAEATEKRSILIVDDNVDIVTVVRRILSTQGYDSLQAFDGKEALETARKHKPDLILLDWMLPEMDGLEVCRLLKSDAETRGIMILLVTGRGSVANRVEGFNAGADDYIPKPFNHPELLARIRSALRLKKLTDDLEEKNRQLVKSQNELVRKEKMATIGLLASGIAHEFNNIMAGISGYAQLARANAKYMPQLVDIALTQSERALELTRSLSTYHRTDAENSHCDLSCVITSAFCLVKKRLEEQGINLVTEFEDKLPRAKIKPGQLQEVTLNLLINAIHAINGKGRITVKVRRGPAPDEVALQVSDTGDGIPKENLDRIFDPFFTTKGALGGGKQEGTGLGLSVCYNVVQARGGNITVESEVGEGTTFTVSLPTLESVEAGSSEGRSSKAPVPVLDSDRSLRILVADDEGFIRTMLFEFLHDHDVVCCDSGQSAVAEYEMAPFDYVILDICMQNSITGLEALQQITERDPDANVILASGRLPEELDSEVRERAHGHLLKPYKLEDLADLLGVTVSV